MARLALTTTPDRAPGLASRCHVYDVDPVLLPCIEYRPSPAAALDEARRAAAGADWLVVTSSRTISALWPDGGMPEVPVAAVGPASARAVRASGGMPAAIGDGGSDELVALLSGRVNGARVVFPHPSGAGGATIDALEAAGAAVEAHVVYEIHPVPPGDDPVDGVVFGSPTAVRGWLMSRSLEGLVTGAIGETTARALEAQSIDVDVIPSSPSFDRLVAAMAGHLRDRSAV